MKRIVHILTASEDFYLQVSKVLKSFGWNSEHLCDSTQLSHLRSYNFLIFDSNSKYFVDDHIFSELKTEGCFVVVIGEQKFFESEVYGSKVAERIATLIKSGLVDDLLLLPLRDFEMLSKLKHFEYRSQVNELMTFNDGVNSDVKLLIEKFEEDLQSARAIQKNLIPEKFKPIPGFRVNHKYLSGMKSGGDYLDFFELGDNTHIGLLMSDSTGYGLSSAFMSVILKMAMKFSADDIQKPSQTIARIFAELQVVMKPRESLSLFLGFLNRKTFELHYCSVGSILFVHGQKEKNKVTVIEGVGEALKKAETELGRLEDRSVVLSTSDRLVLLSDGFSEQHNKSHSAIESVVSAHTDPIDVINQFVYSVKSKLNPKEDEMPEQDCSVLILDVDARALRIAN